MTEQKLYRFYCLSTKDRIIGVEEAHCESDAHARAHADKRLDALIHCHGVEVWLLDKLVHRIRRS